MEATASLIDAFSTYLTTERNLSKATSRAYCSDLRILLVALRAEQNSAKNQPRLTDDDLLIALTEPKLKSIVDSMTRSNEQLSVNRRIAAYRNFFRWLHDNEQKKENIATRLRKLAQSVTRNHVVITTPAELEQVRAVIQRKKSLTGIRTWALIVLMSEHGVRIGTIPMLTVAMYDRHNGTLSLPRTVDKRGQITLSQTARNALNNYQDEFSKRTEHQTTSDSPLFRRVSGEKIGVRSMRRHFESYSKEAGLNEGRLITHERLRRHFIASLYKQGLDAATVCERAGVANVGGTNTSHRTIIKNTTWL